MYVFVVLVYSPSPCGLKCCVATQLNFNCFPFSCFTMATKLDLFFIELIKTHTSGDDVKWYHFPYGKYRN